MMARIKNPKQNIALVHDFLTTLGGGERVLMALHELYPDAPVYTLKYDREGTDGRFDEWDIREAKVAKTWIGRSLKLSLPFLPNAIESFQLSEYDIVISSSSAFAKGVITKPTTLHIAYCHTPMRYVWDWTHEYAKENGYERGLKSVIVRLILHYLRIWDQTSAERVDAWIANSRNVADRIKKYYRKDAAVIYPPVDMPVTDKKYESPTDGPYYLIVSRLSPYKKIDMAIEAAAELKEPLVIIGKGTDRDRLEALANELGAPVAFLGYQDDATIQQYYANCRAFLFPGEDDFGITPVEAMSYGKPVVAYGKGGVLETVVDGRTGILFNDARVDGLVGAMQAFINKESSFDPSAIKKQAEKFSTANFKKNMSEFVDEQWKRWHESR